MDQYIVIGYEASRRSEFEVHTNDGETVKDVQDKVAEMAASRPHIIYTVALVSDFRRFHPNSILAAWAGQEN